MNEKREIELAGCMREMISLGWTLETFNTDFDNCDSSEWNSNEKEICRNIFKYIWEDVKEV